MEQITVSCPACLETTILPRSANGRRGQCNACGKVFVIEGTSFEDSEKTSSRGPKRRLAKETPSLHTEYKKGDRIKVTNGAFINFEGNVDEIMADKGMVRVILTIFGRPTPIELEHWQIVGSDFGAANSPRNGTAASSVTTCRTCCKMVSKEAQLCPHCGQSFPSIIFYCPKCKSTNVVVSQRGFSLGQAIAGGLLVGAVGTLAGALGSAGLVFKCCQCGHTGPAVGQVTSNPT